MKRNYFLLIYCTLLLSGCGKYFYYVDDPKPTDTYQYINLDSTYQLYIRKTYISKKNGYFMLDNTQKPAPAGTPIGEIEYLLFSGTEKKVIYITTVRDKFKDYYSNRGKLTDKDLNVYDFNKFYPGKWITDGLHPSSIGFVDSGSNIYWETSFNTDQSLLYINCRDEYKANGTQSTIAITCLLKNPLVFRRVDTPFKVVFFDKCYSGQKTNTPVDLQAPGRIYFKAGNTAKNGYNIYFRFVSELPPSKNKYKNVKFKNKRLEFSPADLFDN